MEERNYNKQQQKEIRRFRYLGVQIFAVVLLLGFLLGLIFFARPKTSTTEKRTLTTWPAFTLESFLDGSYFEQISLWYSDTYPLRDPLISLDNTLKKTYGRTISTQMIGGNQTADEIPTVTDDTDATESAAAVSTAAVEEEEETRPEVDPPTYEEMEAVMQEQIMAGLYIEDGAAYSIYYFNQTACDQYVTALNGAAEKLDGIANVYSILIPNNSGAMLDEDTLASLGGSDQGQAIDYFYSRFDTNIITIPTYDTLREHNDEYLYFRTDHHWTALGAYYIYKNFCEAKGWTPHELDSFESVRFEPFLGTFYEDLVGTSAADDMKANPDYVDAYIPNGTNSLTFWDTDGTEYDWNVIRDVSDWNQGSGYYTFVGGDRPLAIIENPDITDGSACLVIKESYGNCFIPYLVDHYQTVYIMDFRYAEEDAVDYVKEKGIDDLILINNISLVSNEGVGLMYQDIL